MSGCCMYMCLLTLILVARHEGTHWQMIKVVGQYQPDEERCFLRGRKNKSNSKYRTVRWNSAVFLGSDIT